MSRGRKSLAGDPTLWHIFILDPTHFADRAAPRFVREKFIFYTLFYRILTYLYVILDFRVEIYVQTTTQRVVHTVGGQTFLVLNLHTSEYGPENGSVRE